VVQFDGTIRLPPPATAQPAVAGGSRISVTNITRLSNNKQYTEQLANSIIQCHTMEREAGCGGNQL